MSRNAGQRPELMDDLFGMEAARGWESDEQFGSIVIRRLGPGFWLAAAWIVFIVTAAALAPWLPIADPNETGVGGRMEAPGWSNWFGTDNNGRDMFARTIWGARVSLVVGFMSILLGIFVGGTLGMISGYFRGMVDRVISFVVFVLLAYPGLVLALLIVGLAGQTLPIVATTLGILAIAPIARLSRATTLAYAEREFVAASRVLGATDQRIMVHELLPNVLIPMGALTLLGMAITIVAEGGLAFLGLSVEEGFSWGKMIVLGSAPRTLREGPWVAMFPIGAMFVTVLSLNYAGDRLREYFDVREIGIGQS
ncbi:MAG: ABC transporter permease [Acidimicrobiales bacterium]|nr:ABC transporter permease [Acidimicrobiales bacterium]HJO79941.1 ABC transporter permease [Acidimicrobiales bacterium]